MTATNIQAPLFSTTWLKDTLAIQMPPRLTALESSSFLQIFQVWIQNETSLTTIILDFGQMTLIDSRGVGAFLSNLKSARAQNIQVILRNVTPEVMIVFSLMGLEKLLTFESSEPG
jgi:anti-anti-sigma factor